MNAIVPIGANALIPTDMDQAVRLAKAMAAAKLVPEHLQGDVGSCLLIVEQALRWRMSPFAVAQCTSVIHKRLMFEGKLVAAAIETSGAISGGFDYKFSGTGEDRTITVIATRAGEKEPREIEARLRDVKTSNDIWKKQPDQQLVYAGTRIWARRWAPAVLLGVYAPEEFDRQTGSIAGEAGPVIEHEPEAPAESTARATINAEIPMPPSTPKPERMTARAFLDGFETDCAAATTEEEANAILDKTRAIEDWLKERPAAYSRFCVVRDGMLNRIYAAPPPSDDEEEDTATVDDDPFAPAQPA